MTTTTIKPRTDILRATTAIASSSRHPSRKPMSWPDAWRYESLYLIFKNLINISKSQRKFYR